MIVKTGANYQAEGGYIEFAADNPNGVTMINGRAVPTTLYADVTDITGYKQVKVRKTAESDGQVLVMNYPKLTSLEGVKYRDFANYTVKTTEGNIIIPLGFGVAIKVPTGNIPILADGSNDVQIIHSSSTYFLFITGENPVAVLSYSEA